MQFIQLTDEALVAGKVTFDAYLSGSLCGPGSDAYDASMQRDDGVRVLSGVIIACIEHGLTSEDEIVRSAARVTRCWRSTVRSLLDALTGDDPRRHLWSNSKGRYRNLPRTAIRGSLALDTLLVA